MTVFPKSYKIILMIPNIIAWRWGMIGSSREGVWYPSLLGGFLSTYAATCPKSLLVSPSANNYCSLCHCHSADLSSLFSLELSQILMSGQALCFSTFWRFAWVSLPNPTSLILPRSFQPAVFLVNLFTHCSIPAFLRCSLELPAVLAVILLTRGAVGCSQVDGGC